MITATKTKHYFEIPRAPDIPGLKFYNFRGSQDYQNIIDVFDACKDQDGFEYNLNMDQMDHHFNNLSNCDPYKDMFFVEVAQQVIGYSRVYWWQETEGPYIYGALGFMLPEWRRKGIGTAMIQYNEKRLKDISKEHPADAEKYFENDTHTGREDLDTVLVKMDYDAVRFGFEMQRPIEKHLPDAPMPEGLEVRIPSEYQYRQVWDARSDAFKDHWGSGEWTETDYERFISDRTFNPDIWKVAWDGDEVAGMVLNFVDEDTNREYGIKRGWTENICVLRPWRRRGLARSLLVQSIQMFKEMGMEQTALGVDTQNPSGALDLYESVGYSVVRKTTAYRKRMK